MTVAVKLEGVPAPQPLPPPRIIAEKFVQIYEDEKMTKIAVVQSFEVSGFPLPREKCVPVAVRMSWCKTIYLTCSHQNGDVFLAFPISFWGFLKLKWHRLWRSS